MKNLLYVIAILLIIIWFSVFLSFNASGFILSILGLAVIVLIARIIFDKKLSGK